MIQINPYLKTIRPHQYLKNLLVFATIFFSSQINNPQLFFKNFLAFVVFCICASSVYVLNDIKDINFDKKHKEKKKRPIASGEISILNAKILFFILAISSLWLCKILLPLKCFWILLFYFFLNVFYSSFLKQIAIVDVICIALGFVCRIFMGSFSCDVPASKWLVIMTFLLAAFIAFAKRRDDVLLFNENNNLVRGALYGYSLDFLSSCMVFLSSIIVVTYILYTNSAQIVLKHKTDYLYLTSFWVVIGLLRYMQITFVFKKSGSPTLILLKDFFLQITFIAWLINMYFIFY